MASPESIIACLPHPISDLEAMNYYYGLFSKPVLVARTGNDTWIPPTGLESYLHPKELRSVGIHALNEIWEDQLAFQIHDILDLRTVDWTSTDVVRIEGVIVAQECKQILTTHMIRDVEVEIRESVVTRSLGPKMPTPVLSSEPTAGMLEPLTPTLGLSICNTRTPWMEGSGGFYATDNESNLYLVTARHVVFPPDSANNQEYRYKYSSQPRLDVVLFGSAAYNRYLEGIKHAINNQSMIINFQERRIKKYSNGTEIEPAAARELAVAERVMKGAQDAYMALTALHNEVKKNWSNISHRVLGYIQFAPPIELQVYPKKYTQD
ncbi:hypothetical protein HOY82DRAFT_671098 [Tuber indicum]|nr:hypothetical protein HOY82DRAFT_671098 [Tuber indicum]